MGPFSIFHLKEGPPGEETLSEFCLRSSSDQTEILKADGGQGGSSGREEITKPSGSRSTAGRGTHRPSQGWPP